MADRIRIPSELMRSKLATPQTDAEAAWKTAPARYTAKTLPLAAGE
jgi:hypothetical protein